MSAASPPVPRSGEPRLVDADLKHDSILHGRHGDCTWRSEGVEVCPRDLKASVDVRAEDLHLDAGAILQSVETGAECGKAYVLVSVSQDAVNLTCTVIVARLRSAAILPAVSERNRIAAEFCACVDVERVADLAVGADHKAAHAGFGELVVIAEPEIRDAASGSQVDRIGSRGTLHLIEPVTGADFGVNAIPIECGRKRVDAVLKASAGGKSAACAVDAAASSAAAAVRVFKIFINNSQLGCRAITPFSLCRISTRYKHAQPIARLSCDVVTNLQQPSWNEQLDRSP